MATTLDDTRARWTRLPARMVWRAYLSFVDGFRRTWRGWVATMFGIPVLNLLAFGYGLGHLIGQSNGDVAGVTYVAFLAPGLLAATAMNSAVEESTWAMFTAIKWQRTYYAMLATPLTARQVLISHLLWAATRVAMSATVLLVLIAALGLASPWAVLALPAAILVGPGVRRAGHGVHGAHRLRGELRLPVPVRRDAALPVLRARSSRSRSCRSGSRSIARVTPLWHGVGPVPRPRPRDACSGSTSSTSATSAPCSSSASGWPTSRSAGGWWSEMTATPTTMPPTPAASSLRLTPLAIYGIRRSPAVVERNVMVYRRGWLIFVSGFLEPVFYLFSLGIGLGKLIDSVTARQRADGQLPGVRGARPCSPRPP